MIKADREALYAGIAKNKESTKNIDFDSEISLLSANVAVMPTHGE